MQSGKNFLIVDDDADHRNILILQLRKIDPSIQLFIASDGEEALRTMREEMIVMPDLIFLDLNMPRMDGKEFLIEIKKTSGFKHIPVVIYSTSSNQKDIDDTFKLGAAFYIPKPDKLTELREALINLFSNLFNKTF